MVYAATPIRATSTSLNPTTLQGWWKQITYYFSKSMLNNQEMWFLIGARKTQDFWRQSVARTTATVWNWSGKTLSRRGSSRRSLLFFVPYIFFRPFRLSLAPFICPWVSEDVSDAAFTWQPRELSGQKIYLIWGDFAIWTKYHFNF